MNHSAPLPSQRLHWLAWLGRHSLGYYLLHQPFMIGALMLWLALRH